MKHCKKWKIQEQKNAIGLQTETRSKGLSANDTTSPVLGENGKKDVEIRYSKVIISSAAYGEDKEGEEGSKATWEDMALKL